jgi:Sulfotransferase family
MVSLGRKRFAVNVRTLVPDVVIGGAPRSGTTFLCELLAKHPDVYVARPFIPEPKVCLTPHPAGDAGFLARYAAIFADARPGSICVEKTSYYLENAQARERLVRLLPQGKFVFILRDPVARAYSNWSWSRKNGHETLSFAEAIEQEGRRPSSLPPELDYVRPFDYIKRSQYGTLAEAWIGAVGLQRVAFYVMEAALSAPEVFVEHLQGFIGIEPLSWDRLRTGRINANEHGGEHLDAALASMLRERLGPEIRHFARITGTDVSAWGS